MTGQTNTPQSSSDKTVEATMNKPVVDVSFGIPGYMREFWRAYADLTDIKTEIEIDHGMSYNFAKTWHLLETHIIALHNDVGNAETEGCRVILGNGASQIVSAVAYAAQKMHLNQILLEKPYWGRLKFLLSIGVGAVGNHPDTAVKHHKALITSPWFKFAVSPNNPDGATQEPEGPLSIVDMCYYWPQYTDKIEKKAHDVMIFGLSKATGHAGTRVGWALVKDKKFAALMREYIELSTCGVSNDAQKRAKTVITSARKNDCFKFAKETLRTRWAAFKAVAANAPFKVLNDNGMFAWCQLKEDEVFAEQFMLDTYGLKVIAGSYFGATNREFRINLGCDDYEFHNMIGALSWKQDSSG